MTKLNHCCPRCSLYCQNKTEALEIFGFRVVDGVERVQSYCRKCKLKSQQKVKKIKAKYKLGTQDLRNHKYRGVEYKL